MNTTNTRSLWRAAMTAFLVVIPVITASAFLI